MDCTVSHVTLREHNNLFPEGLFVVVTREKKSTHAKGEGAGRGADDDDGNGMRKTTGNVDNASAFPPSSSSSSSLFVRATDCDRCWSAEVRPPRTTTIDNWTEEVACALSGGIGDDAGGGGGGGGGGGAAAAAAAAAGGTATRVAAPSTFDDALISGTSHSVSAEFRRGAGGSAIIDDARYLDLVLSWRMPNGDEPKVRVSLVADDGDTPAARRSVVALALASARAAGAAAAELSSQVCSLSQLAQRAQRGATGWEAKWRAREGELFAKFCAVLNEKRREVAAWRARALAAEGGAAADGAAAAAAAADVAAAPSAVVPEPMVVELGGGGGAGGGAGKGGIGPEAVVIAPAAGGNDADDDDFADDRDDEEEEEDKEAGGEDRRNDSEKSGGFEEDRPSTSAATDPGDWDPQSDGEGDNAQS